MLLFDFLLIQNLFSNTFHEIYLYTLRNCIFSLLHRIEQQTSVSLKRRNQLLSAAFHRCSLRSHRKRPSDSDAAVESHIKTRYHILYIRDLYIMTSIQSIAVPVRLFSIFNISLRVLDVLFIALSSAILRDSIRQSYWNACIRVSSGFFLVCGI